MLKILRSSDTQLTVLTSDMLSWISVNMYGYHSDTKSYLYMYSKANPKVGTKREHI